MDLIKSRQFYIITHLKVDLSLIIYYLTYLTFLVNFLNQLFKSTYTINLVIKLVVPQAYSILLFQTNIYI